MAHWNLALVPFNFSICFCSLSRWSRPSQINGVLKFYSVFLSSDGSDAILAYNSSEPAEEHTLRSLTPGTFYSVMVAVSPPNSNYFQTFLYLYFCVSTCVFLCLTGLHRRWVHQKPLEPHSDRGEYPRECSCSARHPSVPTFTQHQLDSSWDSKWWEDMRHAVIFRITIHPICKVVDRGMKAVFQFLAKHSSHKSNQSI